MFRGLRGHRLLARWLGYASIKLTPLGSITVIRPGFYFVYFWLAFKLHYLAWGKDRWT